MNFLILLSIIYLIYFGSIYYKVFIIVPIIYTIGKFIIKYKTEICKLNRTFYSYNYDSDSSVDLESGNNSDSDSEIVVDDQYIVNTNLHMHQA
jgi:hypothetical protein